MAESLEKQIATLILDAPQDGKTPQVMEAIAPILLGIAQQFQHLEYFILQNVQQNWQITTLQNQHQPDLTKNVIYGYGTLKDATQAGQDVSLMAIPIPIVDLLFQLISLPKIDSLILLEQHNGELQSLEIQQIMLKQLVQQQLESLMLNPEQTNPSAWA